MVPTNFPHQMANGEGAQDIVEDVPAGKSVDKSGRAQQGNADSQEQPKQGAGPENVSNSNCQLLIYNQHQCLNFAALFSNIL